MARAVVGRVTSSRRLRPPPQPSRAVERHAQVINLHADVVRHRRAHVRVPQQPLRDRDRHDTASPRRDTFASRSLAVVGSVVGCLRMLEFLMSVAATLRRQPDWTPNALTIRFRERTFGSGPRATRCHRCTSRYTWIAKSGTRLQESRADAVDSPQISRIDRARRLSMCTASRR